MVFVPEATVADNAGLIELTKATPMDGLISLCIDREPDFFGLIDLRGGGKVFVGIVDQKIVGCISISYRTVFIGRKPQLVGYISDLKVHPLYRGSRVAIALMTELMKFAKSTGTDLYFCLIADGNTKAFPLMEGRLSVPKFHSIGKFLVYQILPSPMNAAQSEYDVHEATEENVPEIIQMVNAFNENHQFGPQLTGEDLKTLGTKNTSVLGARQGKTICATLGSFDANSVKQNVVIDMPMALKVAVNTMKFASKFFRFFVFPNVGQPLRMLYVRNIAFTSGHEPALRILMQKIRYRAFREKYSFVTVGIHEKYPLRFLVKGLPKFTFVSRGFVSSLSNDEETVARIISGIPFEDYALV